MTFVTLFNFIVLSSATDGTSEARRPLTYLLIVAQEHGIFTSFGLGVCN